MVGAMPPRSNTLKDLLKDACVCLRFWSRLPVPVLPWEDDPHAMPDFARACRMLPVAGAIIGAVGACVLWAGAALGLPSTLAAGLALAALVLATGAFHEDGLADCADGLGGGMTRARKLEIMKDSRIGTFGGAALVLSLGLRWSALAALLASHGAQAAALAMIAVAAFSRVAGLVPAVALEPARADGAAQAAGKPEGASAWIAFALACALPALLVAPLFGARPFAIALTLGFLAAGVMTLIARRHIGGQTGDVCGAAQQLSEIAFLVALCAAPVAQAAS
jgi:adenosylcobinamide-GDP ribazoletransferase